MCEKTPLVKTFLGAALGRYVSEAVFKGAGLKEIPVDFTDAVLSSIQGGTSYIAYRFACESLAKVSPKFDQLMKDKTKNQIPVYIAGGAAGAAFTTMVNFPISVVRSKRTNQKVNFSFKSFQTYYFDRVFAYVGFSASMDAIIPQLKPTNNSLVYWAQTHLLLQTSHLVGNLAEYPVYYLNNKTPFSQYVKNHLSSVARRMLCSDLSCFYKKTLCGVPFMLK